MYPAGATPSYLHDLAGNVWEWTASLYRPYGYKPERPSGRGRERPARRFLECLRGGRALRVPLRASPRGVFVDVIGFRVVVSLADAGF